MWFIYYMHDKKLYAVYSNLCAYTGSNQSSLVVHRYEAGLHRHRKLAADADVNRLLDVWKDDYVVFPSEPARLNWNGAYLPINQRY